MYEVDDRGKTRGIIWLVIISCLALFAAGGFVIMAKGFPWSWELRVANLMGDPPERICPLGPSAKLAEKKFLQRIYPLTSEDERFSLQLQFVQQDQINAFASIGGRIYVNSKLLKTAQTPEELASVVAHEIGHVQNRDIAQGVFSNLLTGGLLSWFGINSDLSQIFNRVVGLKFSRRQEEAADDAAIRRLKNANVSLVGMRDFFHKLEGLDSTWELISDHPASRDRIANVERCLSQTKTPEILTKDEWKELRTVCD